MKQNLIGLWVRLCSHFSSKLARDDTIKEEEGSGRGSDSAKAALAGQGGRGEATPATLGDIKAAVRQSLDGRGVDVAAPAN